MRRGPRIRRRALAPAWVLALTLVGGALPGCRPVRETPETPLHLRLLPLVTGRAWVYRVERPGEPPASSITRVERRLGDRVDMVSGATRYAYEVRPDGIHRPTFDSYLLKAPIEPGASWPGPMGGTVRVVTTELAIEVPAGSFEGCVVIEEAVPAAEVRQVHTYCPDVGEVRLEQHAGGVLLGTAVLVNYAGGDVAP